MSGRARAATQVAREEEEGGFTWRLAIKRISRVRHLLVENEPIYMHGLRDPYGNLSGFQETTLPCLGKCDHCIL